MSNKLFYNAETKIYSIIAEEHERIVLLDSEYFYYQSHLFENKNFTKQFSTIFSIEEEQVTKHIKSLAPAPADALTSLKIRYPQIIFSSAGTETFYIHFKFNDLIVEPIFPNSRPYLCLGDDGYKEYLRFVDNLSSTKFSMIKFLNNVLEFYLISVFNADLVGDYNRIQNVENGLFDEKYYNLYFRFLLSPIGLYFAYTHGMKIEDISKLINIPANKESLYIKKFMIGEEVTQNKLPKPLY